MISLIIVIGIASYLWYLYFHDYEAKAILENCKTNFDNAIKLENTGKVNYVDAKAGDSEDVIPVYYFSVKNTSSDDFGYVILLEEIDGNDGCTYETRLKKEELEYTLKLDNKTINTADLNTISNGMITENTIKGNSVQDYALVIKIKEGITDFEKKHFHYKINIKEKE